MAIEPNSSDSDKMTPLAKRFIWTDSATRVHKFIVGLSVLCGFLFIMDFLWHRHTKVPGEEIFGFYAIAGFVSFSLIVLGAKALRVFIAQDESFYAPHGVDAEEYPARDTDRIDHEDSVSDDLGTLRDDILGRKSGVVSSNDSGASS